MKYFHTLKSGAGPDSKRVVPPSLPDHQVLLLTDFHDFPSSALTLEFWMWSVDTCRPGVPFSYAAGQYQRQDNAFLLFNYNSWGGYYHISCHGYADYHG